MNGMAGGENGRIRLVVPSVFANFALNNVSVCPWLVRVARQSFIIFY